MADWVVFLACSISGFPFIGVDVVIDASIDRRLLLLCASASLRCSHAPLACSE